MGKRLNALLAQLSLQDRDSYRRLLADSDSITSGDEIRTICETFRCLEYLDLDNNEGMREEAYVALSECLTSGRYRTVERLQVLLLENCGLDGGVAVLAVSNAVVNLRKLAKLHLGNNVMLKDDGVKILSFALLQNNTLITLSVCNTRFGDEGISHLCNSLIENRKSAIQFLDVGGNNITFDGCLALQRLLIHNQMLVSLNLGNNKKIGSLGCIRICEGLKYNVTLQKLNLSSIGITPNSAGNFNACFAIGEMLSNTCQSLTKLYLSDNNFSIQGIKMIIN